MVTKRYEKKPATQKKRAAGPYPPSYADLLTGRWAGIFEGRTPAIRPQGIGDVTNANIAQMLVAGDRREWAAIYRFDFQSLPIEGDGAVNYYIAINHAGTARGNLIGRSSNFSSRSIAASYNIYRDGATGWILFPPAGVVTVYTRCSFVILNNATELYFVATEAPAGANTPPAIPPLPSPGNPGGLPVGGIVWGRAKREGTRSNPVNDIR